MTIFSPSQLESNIPSGGRQYTENGVPLMVRDSHSASKFFKLDQRYYNIPKPKFLFFVRFVRLGGINDSVTQNYGAITNYLGTDMNGDPTRQEGATRIINNITGDRPTLVLNVDRPGVNFEIETLNAYGVKRNIQKKIEYLPIKIRFYDTAENTLIKMFSEYFQYYYGEGRALSDLAWSKKTVDNEMFPLPGGHWGLNATKLDFFSRIEIYEFYGKTFTRFDLINPKIENFQPDELDASIGNVGLNINMQVRYDGLVVRDVGSPVTADMVNEFGFLMSDFFDVPMNTSYPNFGPRFGAFPPGTTPSQAMVDSLVENLTTEALRRLEGRGNRQNLEQLVRNSVLDSMGQFSYGSSNSTYGYPYTRPYNANDLIYDIAAGQTMNQITGNLAGVNNQNVIRDRDGNIMRLNATDDTSQEGVQYTGGHYDQAFGILNSNNSNRITTSMLAAGVISAAYNTGNSVDQIIKNTPNGLRISDPGLAGINVLRPSGSQIGVKTNHGRQENNPHKTRIDVMREFDSRFFR
jgi:hypothetical protein